MKKQGMLLAVFVLLICCYGQVFGGFVDQTSQFFGASSVSGGHVSWGDFNNDGWVDLCKSGVVWRNNQGRNFTKLSNTDGWLWGDYNNDGFLDLFGGDELFRNVNGTSFVKVSFPTPTPDAVIRGGVWGDWDGDGYIDLYVGGYEIWSKQITFPDRIFSNNMGSSFTLKWEETVRRARGVTSCDFDEDFDVDIYVSNYRLQPNLLWLNDGKGNFTDVAGTYNAQATDPCFPGGHSIAAAFGDFDNDGHIDLFAGNFAHRDSRGDQPKSRFLKNQGPPNYHFIDKGTCGIWYQESYASPAAGDYDNDGDLDLFFTTVYNVGSFKIENDPVLFRNDGNWKFTDVTTAEGMADINSTYEAAFADFDNDGDLDLMSGGRLWVNQGNSNHWLKVKLIGDGVSVNKSAIGAQVRINVTGPGTLTRQVEAGTGEANQNEMTMHFGLGDHKDPVQLEIRWPNGTVKNVTTPIDRYIQVSQKGL